MAKKKKAKRKSVGVKVGLSAVLAGAAVAATAGAYYLYGPSGKKHQKQVKGWMLKAKGEILERAEKLKEIDVRTYHSLVDEVSKKYKKLKHVNGQDVARLARELKAYWANIEKDLEKKARSGKRVVKKVARKVARKVVKKAQVTKRSVLREKSKGTKRGRVAVKSKKSKTRSVVQNKRKNTKRRR